MDLLFAASPDGEAMGSIYSFMPFILIIAIFYFMIIRPQSKRQKERQAMLDALEKGAAVITSGGVHGRIVRFKGKDDSLAVIQVDDKVTLTVDRSAINGIKGQESDDKA